MSLSFGFFVALLFSVAAPELRYTQVSPGHFSTTTKTTPTNTTTVTNPFTSPTVPATTPKPKNVYFVNDSSEVCILLMADIKIVVKLENVPNSTYEEVVEITKPAEGKCGKQEEYISLNFFKNWKLLFAFSEKKDGYYVSEVNLHFDMEYFPQTQITGKGNVLLQNLTDFGNQEGQGYVCQTGLDMSDTFGDQWNYSVKAEIRNFQVEAFRRNATSTVFNNNAKNCADASANNLIPIIVGSVLIALILLVLVAYLISRRKRRAGYESV